MSDRFQLATVEEKQVFEFLKDGIKQRSDIISHFRGKGGISESTINRILNDNEGKRVFKIEKADHVYYRLNDFSVEEQLLLSALDLLQKKDDTAKLLVNKIKYDILTLTPKISLDQVMNMWLVTMESGDKDLREMFMKLMDNIR